MDIQRNGRARAAAAAAASSGKVKTRDRQTERDSAGAANRSNRKDEARESERHVQCSMYIGR